jgi:hypothetical protein
LTREQIDLIRTEVKDVPLGQVVAEALTLDLQTRVAAAASMSMAEEGNPAGS